MPPSAAPKTVKRASSSAAAPNRRLEDEELKPYVITGDLGKGSFATVYRGINETTGAEVAIKTVNRSSLTEKLLHNLQGEIEILKSLSHRHITRLLDIVYAERNIYLIIEYCSGGDLANYLKKRGRVEGLEYIPSEGAAPTYYPNPRTGGLHETVVRSFLRQLARALKFMRDKNLIHRDIKPQNLLLKPAAPDDLARGHPPGVPVLKVADFGFARNLPSAMLAETLCGSPLYMAPEILRYEKYDAKADLWSVGAVLYEICTGKPPFRAQNHIELLKKIDSSKGIKFPDEDPNFVARQRAETGEDPKPVPDDIKACIRALLKRLPVERMTFEQFFKCDAMVNSRFPRPQPIQPPPEEEPITSTDMTTPEHHKVIPPEVLDPKAMIPPSKFNFRRREIIHGGDGSKENVTLNGGTGEIASPTPPRLSSQPSSKPASGDSSLVPGETDEDGLLRREYVLVDDKRAVEINRAVDEIHAARRKPLRERKTTLSPLNDGQGMPNPTTFPTLDSPDRTSPISFPPPPIQAAPPLSSSPSSVGSRMSNPLTRALNLASKKLFGASSNARSSPYYREYTSSSPRRQQIITSRGIGLGLDVDGTRDPAEDELLASLEELAQKTEVLTHWADEMFESIRAFPYKPLPDPAKFMPREGETERQAAKRKSAENRAASDAMTAVALYILLMTFAQRGIDKLRNFHEHLQMKDPDGEIEVSEGFDEALTWFKDQFIKCHERAALVKTWLPAQYSGPPAFLDQLVYDRALQLSKIAARKELLDSANSPDECEKLYEESLWCLYALQDDLLQTDNPFTEEDRAMISTWIKRTKLRLVRCRVRMGMSDRDRLRDARLDKNLDDVPRDPPPWEVPVLEQQNSVPPSPTTQRS
ncbi:other/ULK/ULK protein kinase [Panus rudis PR-1116 ss-1]|nr:other/ULK/ULK protein kinase [Panus rudis PR-1116 ss-1]